MAEQAVTVNAKVSKPTNSNKRLPLSRVKRIAKMDEDVVAISNAGALLITGATERFAAYFAEQSYFFTLAEKKKGLQYRHCAAAVARLPQLDFLADVVPQLKLPEVTKRVKETTTINETSIPAWALPHPEVAKKLEEAMKRSRETNATSNDGAPGSAMEQSTEQVESPEAGSPMEEDD